MIKIWGTDRNRRFSQEVPRRPTGSGKMPTAPGSGEMPVRTTDGNEGGIGTGVRWRPVSAAASLARDRAWGQRTRPPTHGRGRTAPAGTPGTGAQRRRRRRRPPQPRGWTGEASRAEGHGCLTVPSVRGLRALESRERAGVVVPGLGVGQRAERAPGDSHAGRVSQMPAARAQWPCSGRRVGLEGASGPRAVRVRGLGTSPTAETASPGACSTRHAVRWTPARSLFQKYK